MKVLGIFLASIGLILLIGIYEQLSIANMSAQERIQYDETQLKTSAEREEKRLAELKVENEKKIERERILSATWSELKSDSEKMYWLYFNFLIPLFLIGLILSVGFNLVRIFAPRLN